MMSVSRQTVVDVCDSRSAAVANSSLNNSWL